MRSDHVLLRALELLDRDRLLAQPRKFRQKARARGLFLLRRRRDVGEKNTGESFCARAGVDGVSERLPIAKLVEEAASQSARNSADERCSEARVVVSCGTR